MIYVCSMAKVADTIASSGAGKLVTLLSKDTRFDRPASIAAADHLLLSMHDILEEQAEMIAPGQIHVETLLDFVRAWDRRKPILIHCFAGISRSTAAAYITACALAPEREEAEIAEMLRRLSPSATPNARLVNHADAILGRDGRMVAAIAAIGRGADAYEGSPFCLPIAV